MIGDHIKVKVGGIEYDTVIDEHGVQRFVKNKVITTFCNPDLNKLAVAYGNGKGLFSQREYAEFNMMLGYSVCGFADLSSFQDMEIENPLWE